MKFRDLGRFWRKVQFSSPYACWLWRGYRDADGYGGLRIGGRWMRAHRLAYWLSGEPIPPGVVIRHRCNNPACVNPRHLAAGTHADNVADRCAAGHSACGERNGRAKLTWAAVRDIRARQNTATPTELAHEYGVSQRAVTLIWAGVNWKTADV